MGFYVGPPMLVAQSQQCNNIGEKLTVILHAYTNHHVGKPEPENAMSPSVKGFILSLALTVVGKAANDR